MKRHNIYLYEYSNDSKGKNVGFCRMDVNDDNVKMLLNIKGEELGVIPDEIVDIKADLLMEGGERKPFACNEWKKNIENFSHVVETQDVNGIIGISLLYQKKNDIRIKVQGIRENCEFIENNEVSGNNQNVSRIQQVELEDTVYNVDMECVKERQLNAQKECTKSKLKISGIDHELIKVSLDDVTSLPRSCWKLVKNKFVVCGCNRYGHLAYIKQGDNYIICVPGNLDQKNAGCARRFGFKTYFPIDEDGEEEKFNGYWMMSVSNNGK